MLCAFVSNLKLEKLVVLCYNQTKGGGTVSHSKFRIKGQSLYLDKWNSAAKKYIHICYLCGRKGYSPAIEEEDFATTPGRKVIYTELTKTLNSALELDSFGRCAECAKRQDGQ